MSLIRTFYKILLLILMLVAGIILAIFFFRNTMPAHGLISRMSQIWHRCVLFILGVKLKVSGERENANVLFVPNHVSWLDIPVLGALIPTHFLSKSEIKNWPVIGTLATLSGTLYIKRGGRNAGDESNDVMRQALEKNHNVILFAEGTTTDGVLRKFHGRLMQSAIDAESLVQPVAIFYPDKSSRTFNRHILYIDKTHFLKSAFTIFSLKEIHVEIQFLSPVSAKGKTRGQLAGYCYDSVHRAINKSK